MKHTLLILLCVLLITLFGCKGRSSGQTTPDTATVTALVDLADGGETVSELRLYTATELENPDGYVLGSSVAHGIYREGSLLCIPTGNVAVSGEAGTTVLKYNTDGKCIEAVKIPYLDTVPVIAERPLANGTYLYFTAADNNYVATKLMICDENLTPLYETSLSAYSYSVADDLARGVFGVHTDVRDDGSARILVNAYDKLYYLDETLTVLNTVAISAEYTAIHRESDGVYILGNTVPGMSRVDMNTGTLTAIDAPILGITLPEDTVYSFLDDGTILYSANGAVYRATPDGDVTELFQWVNGVYNGNGAFWAMSDTTLCLMPEPDKRLDLAEPVMLTQCAEDKSDTRRVVTLVSLSSMYMDRLSETAAMFNAENDTYYLHIVDISAYTDTQSPAERFADYLLTYGTPDMVVFPGNWDADNYIDKNLFVDLAPHYGDQLLLCASSAFTYDNGCQYLLPLTLDSVDTYLSADAVLDENLTWEQLYAFAAELDATPVGGVLTSTEPTFSILRSVIHDHMDAETKTASFDSDLFREQIRFLDAWEERYTDPSYGQLTDLYATLETALSSNDYMLIGGTAIADAIKTGEVRLMEVPLRKLRVFPILKRMFGETPFTFCGYPTQDGTAPCVYTRSSVLASIFADSETLGGCKAFLDFALSDDMQSSEFLTDHALPVTLSGMRAALETYRYSYFLRELLSLPLPGADERYTLFTVYAHGAAQKDVRGEDYEVTVLTDADIENILAFFDTAYAIAELPDAVDDIVNEELSAYREGAKTLDDVTKLIQSRVFIYLNE